MFLFLTLIKFIKERTILNETCYNYLPVFMDHIGLINPIVVCMKVLLQDICVAKYRWDDLLHDELLKRWHNILTDLHNCKI